MKTHEKLKQPFFARFLEGQTRVSETAQKNQNGSPETWTSKVCDDDGVIVTLKFPSDNDEWLL